MEIECPSCTRLRAELETAQHDAAKEKARADFCHNALGNKCQEIDRMESRAMKAESELETERRKVEVAKVALKKLWDFPFFGAADSLGRMNLDETADRMRALSAVVGNALAALTPSEKGEG